jgi:enterochelin esterase-like enzyme
MRTTVRVTFVACFLVAGLFAQQPCKSTVVGELHVEHLESKMYGKTMTVRVWLPPGYTDPSNATRKYPTLYFLDGQNAFDECTAFQGEHELQIDETITRLIAENSVPPMIVVGIDSTHDRDYEYEPYKNPINDAKEPDPIGRQLPSFLADEVIPYVSARYRVTDDPVHTGIGGTSLGGFAALYVALNRPDLFRLVLAESPDLLLGNGQLLRDTTLLDRAPDRVALGVGSTELNFPQAEKYLAPIGLSKNETEAGVVKMTQILASNLQTAFLKSAKVRLVVDPGANHSAVFWARRIPADVTFLYGDDSATH